MQRAEDPVMGCCEQGNETVVSIICGELFEKLNKYQIFKNDYSTRLIKLQALQLPIFLDNRLLCCEAG
jgi:hypothetical protein